MIDHRSRRALISSRFDKVSSRSIEPITVRRLVVESAMIAVEVADFISGFGGVEDLEEDHPVDRHHGVVLGDDLLAGDVEHLLHHVDLATDAVEEGGTS